MPETITLEDGTTREVPTQEEIEALQQASTKVTEYETTLKTKEEEHLAKVKELEEMVNPNWKAAREKLERFEKMEKQGKTIGEDGSVVDKTPTFDPEALVKRATEAGQQSAMETILSERKRTLLAKYQGDTKGVVEHYFNKLITNEKLTLENMEEFVKQAEVLAVPSQGNNLPPSPNGAPPRFVPQNGQNFSDSPEAKDIAKDIWGTKAYSVDGK